MPDPMGWLMTRCDDAVKGGNLTVACLWTLVLFVVGIGVPVGLLILAGVAIGWMV